MFLHIAIDCRVVPGHTNARSVALPASRHGNSGGARLAPCLLIESGRIRRPRNARVTCIEAEATFVGANGCIEYSKQRRWHRAPSASGRRLPDLEYLRRMKMNIHKKQRRTPGIDTEIIDG
jgi:hypothetical protein